MSIYIVNMKAYIEIDDEGLPSVAEGKRQAASLATTATIEGFEDMHARSTDPLEPPEINFRSAAIRTGGVRKQ